MATFNSNDNQKTANLAKLTFSSAQQSAMAEQLETILEFAEQICSIDTDGIEPLAHPLEITQPQRQDQVSESNQREAFQSNAPLCEAGLYLVPQVIE